MNDITEQQEIALKVMNKLIENDCTAVVAGGAPRDWLMNKPCRDLDIYTSITDFAKLSNQFCRGLDIDIRRSSFTEEVVYEAFIDNLFKEFIWVVKDETQKSSKILTKDYSDGFPILKAVTRSIKGLEVQFLFVNSDQATPQLIIENFDFNLCKCFFTTDGYSVPSKEFSHDLMNKTLTFNLSRLSDARKRHSLLYHAPKMLEYFPDFKLNIL